VADAAYFTFLERVSGVGETEYGLHTVWTWTEAAEVPILASIVTVGGSAVVEDPAARLRALTAQLRHGVIPPVAPEVRDLANRVVTELAATDEDDTDEWARRLAQDVAQADD
jgi:hypothetical protein